MRLISKTHLFPLFLISFFLFLCFAIHSEAAEDKTDCVLQGQNAASLAAVRYISIIEGIQNGAIEEAIKDMDWWVDQAIMELQYLEEKYPYKHIEQNKPTGPEGIITYKRIYRDIARYRRDHPRKHKVPLDSHKLKIIDAFVKKYE